MKSGINLKLLHEVLEEAQIQYTSERNNIETEINALNEKMDGLFKQCLCAAIEARTDLPIMDKLELMHDALMGGGQIPSNPSLLGASWQHQLAMLNPLDDQR